MSMSFTTAIRGNFFDIAACVDQPQQLEQHLRHIPDGLLLLDEGTIVWFGPWQQGEALLPPGFEVTHYPNKLIVPGFIDSHIHYPQTEMIGAYGDRLLAWLKHYTFPTESQFCCEQHSDKMSAFFLQQLLSNGTTTALVFGTVHPQSVEALFSQAAALNMRLIAGKVMMDRHAPDELLETPEQSYRQTRELIERWHGKQRLSYAITPRFAPTSTPEQLALAGQLLGEYPGLYMQTHISENKQEVEWVKALFPERNGYLDVYEHYKLLGERSVFAHGVHLCDDECARLAETGSAVAFCPTSNFFLGSGLFNLPMAEKHKLNVGLGTDVGGGTSFSLLQTLNEAYKVMQLQGARLSPFKSLYLATLGGARALRLEDKIGTLQPGTDADFLVLDYNATPLLSYRLKQANNIAETLFVLMTLGDDRTVLQTYAAGQLVHQR